MTVNKKTFGRAILVLAATFLSFPIIDAQAQNAAKGASGLPLPRFASFKSPRVNMRVGPGTQYSISWLFERQGLPVEIISEFENWRRIRDADGTEGWVYHAMLSGERSAVAAPWMKDKTEEVFVSLHKSASKDSAVLAKMQPGVIMRLKDCSGEWCEATADGVEGFVSQSEIWGAYPGEAFK